MNNTKKIIMSVLIAAAGAAAGVGGVAGFRVVKYGDDLPRRYGKFFSYTFGDDRKVNAEDDGFFAQSWSFEYTDAEGKSCKSAMLNNSTYDNKKLRKPLDKFNVASMYSRTITEKALTELDERLFDGKNWVTDDSLVCGSVFHRSTKAEPSIGFMNVVVSGANVNLTDDLNHADIIGDYLGCRRGAKVCEADLRSTANDPDYVFYATYYVKERDPQKVVDEMKELEDKYGELTGGFQNAIFSVADSDGNTIYNSTYILGESRGDCMEYIGGIITMTDVERLADAVLG